MFHYTQRWVVQDPNSGVAQSLLAWCYLRGIGVEQDRKLAFDLLQPLSVKGCACSQWILAQYYEKDRPKKAFEWMLLAAKQHYSPAENDLAIYFEEGTGTEQNLTEAAYWYKRAIKKQHISALVNFAELLNCQDEPDFRQIFSLVSQAAEFGSLVAWNRVGYCHFLGRGTEKNLEAAFRAFERAAEKNGPVAQCNLGLCFEHGFGTEIDVERAFELYRLAAEQGSENGRKKLDKLQPTARVEW